MTLDFTQICRKKLKQQDVNPSTKQKNHNGNLNVFYAPRSVLYRHGSCPPDKSGVPLWTIAAAIGVVLLISLAVVLLRSVDQLSSPSFYLILTSSISLLIGERDLRESLRLRRLRELNVIESNVIFFVYFSLSQFTGFIQI